jgi:hypothetical protein
MLKRDLFLIATLVLAISLFACNGAKESDSTPSAASETTTSPSSTEPSDTIGSMPSETSQTEAAEMQKLTIIVGSTEFTATMENNSSAEALIELLSKKPLTIEMQDYGNMEKVGGLGTSLPTNNEQITTAPGDLILYQGNALVIYYAPNSWNFTRLGKIDNVTAEELNAVLGNGSVTVTLSLGQ